MGERPRPARALFIMHEKTVWLARHLMRRHLCDPPETSTRYDRRAPTQPRGAKIQLAASEPCAEQPVKPTGFPVQSVFLWTRRRRGVVWQGRS